MKQVSSRVLHSLLDTDAYKLHMQQAVFHHYDDVHVAAEFRCRGDDLLGIFADAIREQVQAMQHLRLQDDEYQWLSALPFFKADYLNWLREFRFNPEPLLDTDAYKLHMQQAVFHHYYDVHVAAEFRCRGDDLLGIYADAIREQIQAMQHLRLQDDEYQWLSALPFFKADYLNWLREFRFNPEQVTVSNDNGKLDIRLSGPWREVILWEVPLLAVISEMVHRYRSPQADVAQALRYRSPQADVAQALDTLESKLVDFSALTAGLDMSRFHLMDFGTRRRFYREVQETIVKRLQQESWFVGTSNYDLARRLSLTPMGTQAHEWFPAHQHLGINRRS